MERKLDDARDRVRLVRKSEVLELLGISGWTLDQWLREGRFPRPLYTSDGAPARWRLAEIERWLDTRQGKRRRPIRRGRLKRAESA